MKISKKKMLDVTSLDKRKCIHEIKKRILQKTSNYKIRMSSQKLRTEIFKVDRKVG